MEAEFQAAVKRVNSSTVKVSDQVKLSFYSLYKQATVGKCNVPRPSFFDFVGKLKWDAWNKLGDMSKEDAMRKYIETTDANIPNNKPATSNSKPCEGGADAGAAAPTPDKPKSISWAVFSKPQGSGVDENHSEKDVWDYAADGNTDKALESLKKEKTVDVVGEENRTPFMIAVDRGHVALAKALIERGADVNHKDSDGLTALHYACLCENPEMIDMLVKNGADENVTDNDGSKPKDYFDYTNKEK